MSLEFGRQATHSISCRPNTNGQAHLRLRHPSLRLSPPPRSSSLHTHLLQTLSFFHSPGHRRRSNAGLLQQLPSLSRSHWRSRRHISPRIQTLSSTIRSLPLHCFQSTPRDYFRGLFPLTPLRQAPARVPPH